MNLWAAWIGILLGMVTGAVQGLFFHADGWLGGYGSWRRRLLRLGHISFFGLAFVNLAFVFTVDWLGGQVAGGAPSVDAAAWLLVAGAALMPATCYAAAWRPGLRHLFVGPVSCLVVGITILLIWGTMR